MKYDRPFLTIDKNAVVCDGCGSVVMDTDAHDEWHADINHIARQADHADTFTRPIG